MHVVDRENSSTSRSKDFAILLLLGELLLLVGGSNCRLLRLRSLSELVACCNGGIAL